MEHEQAERLISERLDGERLSARGVVALDRHLEGCAECRAFERGAYRLREAARFEVAPAVPDLVEPIMAAVEREATGTGPARPRGLRVLRPGTERVPAFRSARRSLIPRLVPVLAALVVGALVGSLVVGGPWRDGDERGSSALAASDVTEGVMGAAASLQTYGARFTITEFHLSPDVPRRDLKMRVWFEAPERFRLEVVDETVYPSGATPTDLRLIVDGSDWYSSGPALCPSTTCPQREIRIRNRAPFSSSALAPTDLVLPLTALGDPEGVEVIGRGTVLGHDAVEVEVAFERASSLFPFLSLGGQWRPFFPNDRVRIWLDAESWFPLRWEVFPAAGAERDAWALRFGLPEEPSRRPIFEVAAISVRLAAPPEHVFAIPSTGRTQDQGAHAASLVELADQAGFEPLQLSHPGGLDLYRVVLPVDTPEETLLTYADGLTFLKVGETRSWSDDAPFGPIGVRAEEVALDGGVAYYEPASPTHGRRLAIHAAGTDVYLETNLSRSELLAVADTIAVRGLAMPPSWRIRDAAGARVERLSLEAARAQAPFEIEVPSALPAGTALASVELTRAQGDDELDVGVTLYFGAAETDLGDASFRLHLEAASMLPSASSARQSEVAVGEVVGRWIPDRMQLEWVADGVYRSIDGPGMTLSEALRLADSIGA